VCVCRRAGEGPGDAGVPVAQGDEQAAASAAAAAPPLALIILANNQPRALRSVVHLEAKPSMFQSLRPVVHSWKVAT
jgi:hypothetical protein